MKVIVKVKIYLYCWLGMLLRYIRTIYNFWDITYTQRKNPWKFCLRNFKDQSISGACWGEFDQLQYYNLGHLIIFSSAIMKYHSFSSLIIWSILDVIAVSRSFSLKSNLDPKFNYFFEKTPPSLSFDIGNRTRAIYFVRQPDITCCLKQIVSNLTFLRWESEPTFCCTKINLNER